MMPRRPRRPRPQHDLTEIQRQVRADPEGFNLTGSAERDAGVLNLDAEDVRWVLLQLKREHFRESVPSDLKRGSWQDVYDYDHDCGTYVEELFIKLQMEEGEKPVVISFHLR